MKKGKQKQKITADYGLGDMYKYYIDNLDSIEKNSDLNQPRRIYGSICRDFNESISNLIIFHAFTFKIPARMGELRCRKTKAKIKIDENGDVKNLPINFKATTDLWEKNPEAKEKKKKIYHTNDHTDGWVHQFYYNKFISDVVNQTAYRFIPSRTNKRVLAQGLKNPEIKINNYE